MRGRFIFCLSGNNDWKSYYAKTNARRRLCFADADFDDSKRATVPTRGQRIIYSSNLYTSNAGTWQESIGSLRAANLIVRGYVLNGEGLWGKAKAGKLTLFAIASRPHLEIPHQTRCAGSHTWCNSSGDRFSRKPTIPSKQTPSAFVPRRVSTQKRAPQLRKIF